VGAPEGGFGGHHPHPALTPTLPAPSCLPAGAEGRAGLRGGAGSARDARTAGTPRPPGTAGECSGARGVAQTPAPRGGGDLEDGTAPVAVSRRPALVSQGEQGPDGPIGKEVPVRALGVSCPAGPQGAILGGIPTTPLLCVSPGPPRKARHRRTSRPEGEGRARPCPRPGTPQPPGVLGLSPASPPLCRAKLGPPARGATPGRRAEPACPGGRGRAAPWASWGHGGRRVRGVPPAHRDLRAALGCRAPQG